MITTNLPVEGATEASADWLIAFCNWHILTIQFCASNFDLQLCHDIALEALE